MNSVIANNDVAKRYKEIESSIDWTTASDQEQLLVMQKMVDFLSSCPSGTPIYDWGTYDIATGNRIYTTASERLSQIQRRINRFSLLVA